jgi:hypothetical protein
LLVLPPLPSDSRDVGCGRTARALHLSVLGFANVSRSDQIFVLQCDAFS